ncbi:MAG TPA: hypothetical protein VFG23_10670 [Polyangia bacterium]|nr:hypothetical protein [Polyangia bacterium]
MVRRVCWSDRSYYAAGAIKEFAIPSPAEADGIAAGPDGNLWFTEDGVMSFGICTTNGMITEKPFPTAAMDASITVGANGNIWFVEGGITYPQVARISVSGVATEFPIPTLNSNPQGIAAGADGNIWFAENGKIGRMTTSGAATVEFSIPGGISYLVTPGPDGNIWFTGGNGSDPIIGNITPDGTVTAFPVSSVPNGITSGPDGNIWFTEPSYGSAAQIGRFIPP